METLLIVLAILGGIGGLVYLCTLIYGLFFKTKQDKILEKTELIHSTVIEVFDYVDGLPQTRNVKLKKLFEKGVQYHKEKRWKDALVTFKACLNVHPKAGEVVALHILIANLLIRISKVDEALEGYNHALKLALDIKEKEARAAALMCRGSAYLQKGNLENAYNDLVESLRYYGDSGGVEEAAILSEIGHVFRSKGLLKEAQENFENSKKIYTRMGSKKGIADQYCNLSTVYYRMEDLESMENCLTKALQMHNSMGDEQRVAVDMLGLGVLYNKRQKLRKALKYFKKALKIFEKFEDLSHVAECANNIGLIYGKKWRFRKAVSYCERGLKIRMRIGNPIKIAHSQKSLALICMRQIKLERAKNLLNESTENLRKAKLTSEIKANEELVRLIEEIKMRLTKKWFLKPLRCLIRR